MRRSLMPLVGLALCWCALLACSCRRNTESFEREMVAGQGAFERGDATNAIAAYSKALKLVPESIDAHLNLANAYLLANNPQAVVEQCQQVLKLDHNQPAAYYLTGCAYLRLNQVDPAIQSFQQSQKIDPAVDALNFQLGVAQERAGHLEDAIREFETLLQFEPDHPSAHYQLSRLYQRVGRTAEAAQELAKHQQLLAKNPNVSLSPFALEKCKYTQPRVAFSLDQPETRGISVRFSDSTANAFGQSADKYHGPFGVIDYNHDGRNSLFVIENNGFRLLDNTNGHFVPLGEPIAAATNGPFRTCLVGDLNNDHFEDIVFLGEQGSHVFRFATNGAFREVTAAAGLKNLKARDGVLADVDFTGKLDLLTLAPGGEGPRVYRNLGSFYFVDYTTNSGLPLKMEGAERVAVADWQNEDIPGVVVTRTGKPPAFFAKQRAGGFVETNSPPNLPAGSITAFADFNNDLLMDLVVASAHEVTVVLDGKAGRWDLPARNIEIKGLLLVDYDNDGWMDIIAYGSGIQIWRNIGKQGFREVTAEVGFDKAGAVDFMAAADFDGDGDTDFITSSAKGLQYWRNDGGNANKQLKLQLVGTRSNASALGTRVQLVAGHWRTLRSLDWLPFEIGVGKHDHIELLQTRWSDLAATLLDVPVQPQPLSVVELVVPSGSCPYLYAWDGKKFRFVTDILGAAPLGLPVSYKHWVEQDPEEYLALGNQREFPSKYGQFEIRVTEELREVLYLDQAKLIAADHPAGTMVVPTSKMHAAGPFPPHELWTLRQRAEIKQAIRSDGADVTDALRAIDERMTGPVHLREPQLRGLAEPFSLTLDFGDLPTDAPIVLVMNGWIRFGGGMANIAGSMDPGLPFPFPRLEVELADGTWEPVNVDFGVPAGKTKTMLVDLEGKLPPGGRRLRITTAFELYWNWAVICDHLKDKSTGFASLKPAIANLHWRGFSEFAALPEFLPLTPEYEKVFSTPPWLRTPSGWCTRYGPVDELVAEKDNALALLNGGDELALTFDSRAMPPQPAGTERDYFLYVVGWDKDADFHVVEGWRVEPLPFLGLHDQSYATECRPAEMDQGWIKKYNTRWVGSKVLARRQP